MAETYRHSWMLVQYHTWSWPPISAAKSSMICQLSPQANSKLWPHTYIRERPMSGAARNFLPKSSSRGSPWWQVECQRRKSAGRWNSPVATVVREYKIPWALATATTSSE